MTVLAPAPADPVAVPAGAAAGLGAPDLDDAHVLAGWLRHPSSTSRGERATSSPPSSGEPSVLATSDLHAVTGRARDVAAHRERPAYEPLQRLVGCRAGGNLRSAIAQELPDQVEAGTPLHLLARRHRGRDADLRLHLLPLGRRGPGHARAAGQRTPERHARHLLGVPRRFERALPNGSLRGVSSNTPVAPSLSDPGRPARLARTRGSARDRHVPRPADRRVAKPVTSSSSTPCSATPARSPRAPKWCCTSTRSSARPTAATATLRDRAGRSPGAALPRVPAGGAQRPEDGRHRTPRPAHRGAGAAAIDRLLHPPQRRAALARRGPRAGGVAATGDRPEGGSGRRPDRPAPSLRVRRRAAHPPRCRDGGHGAQRLRRRLRGRHPERGQPLDALVLPPLRVEGSAVCARSTVAKRRTPRPGSTPRSTRHRRRVRRSTPGSTRS